MTEQLKNGKGFEWAVAIELSEHISTPIAQDSNATIAEAHFRSLTPLKQRHFRQAASAAVKHIIEKEQKRLDLNAPKSIRLAGDFEGSDGDVRDVFLISETEVLFGISCKSNHAAFKHSRLSSTIDWVRDWGLDHGGISDQYKSIIDPIFSDLRRLKAVSKGQALWSGLTDKVFDYYEPVLQAFEMELQRLYSTGDKAIIASNLAAYVIGRADFYKVIVRSKEVKIMAFNFNGSLSVRKSKLPVAIHAIDRFEGSRHSLNVRFDRGYSLNFRIHNASSRIEPSLKFDIQAKSLPSEEIYQHHISF